MNGLLKALGVRVRRVTDMRERKLWVPNRQLLFLDFDLSVAEVSAAYEEILPEAFVLQG